MLDRLSFQRFCRLEGALNIPDARTLWNFRQQLAEGGLGGRAIFESLSQQLQRHGFIPRGGQIVDASIVQAPITQANAREREVLNKGEAPEGWSKKRLAHTDRDARWTIKHGKAYYGYKLHGNVFARYKLIRQMKITAANADDGQQLPDVLQVANTRKRLLADRGYDSAVNRQTLQQHGLADGIARRVKPGQTAKVRLKQRNKTINRTRARVEHVFAAAEQAGWQVRAGDDAGAQCTGDHAAVRGLQRAQADVAGQERRCVCAARISGKTPSQGAVTAGAAAGRCHQLRGRAGIVRAKAWLRAALPVSGSALGSHRVVSLGPLQNRNRRRNGRTGRHQQHQFPAIRIEQRHQWTCTGLPIYPHQPGRFQATQAVITGVTGHLIAI